MLSTASSSSGNRCDRTKQQLAQSRTQEPLDHEVYTLTCRVSLDQDWTIFFIYWTVQWRDVLMLSVGPTVTTGLNIEQLSHLCRNSNNIVLEWYHFQILCAFIFHLNETLIWTTFVGLQMFDSEIWLQSTLLFCIVLFSSRTPMNVTQLLLPAGLQFDPLLFCRVRRGLPAGYLPQQPLKDKPHVSKTYC